MYFTVLTMSFPVYLLSCSVSLYSVLLSAFAEEASRGTENFKYKRFTGVLVKSTMSFFCLIFFGVHVASSLIRIYIYIYNY